MHRPLKEPHTGLPSKPSKHQKNTCCQIKWDCCNAGAHCGMVLIQLSSLCPSAEEQAARSPSGQLPGTGKTTVVETGVSGSTAESLMRS